MMKKKSKIEKNVLKRRKKSALSNKMTLKIFIAPEEDSGSVKNKTSIIDL